VTVWPELYDQCAVIVVSQGYGYGAGAGHLGWRPLHRLRMSRIRRKQRPMLPRPLRARRSTRTTGRPYMIVNENENGMTLRCREWMMTDFHALKEPVCLIHNGIDLPCEKVQ
jgi:hypothetical protein